MFVIRYLLATLLFLAGASIALYIFVLPTKEREPILIHTSRFWIIN